MDKTEELRRKLEVMLPRNKAGNDMLRTIIRTAKQQAKKEVFEDVEELKSDGGIGKSQYIYVGKSFMELKKKHLGK